MTTEQLQTGGRWRRAAPRPRRAAAASARRRHPSLASFYRSDPRRLRSRETDVGLWWREQADGPLHRAAWVHDTGELYLVRLGPAECGGGQVEVLGVFEDNQRLERQLCGWRRVCGGPRSLGWLRTRLAAPPGVVPFVTT